MPRHLFELKTFLVIEAGLANRFRVGTIQWHERLVNSHENVIVNYYTVIARFSLQCKLVDAV